MSQKKSGLLQINPNRNYGIDLLRILAMYMVVTVHVLAYGGILNPKNGSDAIFRTAWFLEIAVYGAVDIYALISGFVGYKAKHRYASLAELWLQVFLYSVSFTCINKLFVNRTIGMKKILFSFFPVTKGGLWYFTMYFALFFLTPVLNAAVEALPRKVFRNTLVASVFFFTVLPFLWAQDAFALVGGYSVMWLIVLYLIGAYIGKYRAFDRMKKPAALLGYVGCVAVVWGSKFCIRDFFPTFFGQANQTEWLVNYTSLPVVLSSVFLLIVFRDLKLPGLVKKVVGIAAPLSFGVYVIHFLPLFRQNVIRNRFTAYASYPPAVMALAVLGTAAAIYLVCSALDFVRARLFDLLKVKERLIKAEDRLLGRFM